MHLYRSTLQYRGAFDHYDDGIEHSLWLSLMRRSTGASFERLLVDDGSLWISIDDNEMPYLQILWTKSLVVKTLLPPIWLGEEIYARESER